MELSKTFLRVEGLAALGIALGGYVTLDGPIWLLIVLALGLDLSMLGYLPGSRVGALSYSVIHTDTLPLALGGLGFWADGRTAFLIALIWGGHIGADRLFGYGLKFEFGFKRASLYPARPAPSTERNTLLLKPGEEVS